ncbi:PASTA domain-containing protein [Streptomyces polygonati]|uniref:PASTA domain-containing protein n=1 Tax=Streptomyces polygonati TaxID=1617087 RepID=A0ABV8HKU3_9ACTN
MRTRGPAAAIVLIAAVAAAVTGCDPHATDPQGPGAATSGSTGAAAARTVPDLVGKGLQAAQDTAQAAGFHHLTSHDSAGRSRHQILDRDWKVCSQKPAAGTKVSAGTEIDLGSVKLAESCPRSDRTPPAKAGATMPDFTGKALNTAADSLPSNTSIGSSDAAGHRVIVLRSNWRICTQKPAAGTRLNGQPVMFTAVKFGERCP